MKSFFKNVLANIVAIFLVGAFVSICFFLFVLISSIGSGSKVSIKENSVLVLDSKLRVMDSPTEESSSFFIPVSSQPQSVLLYDVLKAIKNAKTDDNIKGISINADFIIAGNTQLDNIREALKDFKKSGKFVYFYGNNVTQSAYYVGSVADKVFLNPMGVVDLKGLATEVVFLKDFTDKYGIEMEVLRHGSFKAAVEPYMRNSISDENKEQLSVLLNDLWGNISKNIVADRKMSSAEFKVIADSLYGVIPENNTKYKLVDQLMQKSEYESLLKEKLGVKDKKELSEVSMAKYISSLKDKESTKSDKIAVLYASGAIYNGEGYQDIYSTTLIKEIKKIKENDNIKAVVFRVNSPGGSANASEEILFELQELKKKKPVITSFGDYAASGGYYISMASDRIFSEPNTVTGSIGVFGAIPNFESLAEKNGIRSDIVSTNANSRYHSPFHGLTPTGREMMQKSIEGTYKRFVHWVTVNRKKSFEEIDAIGGGRVWSGTRAKELGLVDNLGSLQDAINYAQSKAGLKDYSVESFPKKLSTFEQLLKDMNYDTLESKILERRLGKENMQMIESITDPRNKGSIITELPYRIKW